MNQSSASALPFALFRVHQDGTQRQVSEHASFGEGWAAGQHAAHEDRQGAFSLYCGERRVARFCHHRIAVRRESFDWSVLG